MCVRYNLLVQKGNKNIFKVELRTVPKINGGLTGLEQHEGESLMISFLGELTL